MNANSLYFIYLIKPSLNTACTDMSTLFYSFANKFDNFDYEFHILPTKDTYLIVFVIGIINGIKIV